MCIYFEKESISPAAEKLQSIIMPFTCLKIEPPLKTEQNKTKDNNNNNNKRKCYGIKQNNLENVTK